LDLLLKFAEFSEENGLAEMYLCAERVKEAVLQAFMMLS